MFTQFVHVIQFCFRSFHYLLHYFKRKLIKQLHCTIFVIHLTPTHIHIYYLNACHIIINHPQINLIVKVSLFRFQLF